MLRNLLILFFLPGIIFTFLDVITTYIGINHYGFVELNLRTDTSSLRALILPEFFTLLAGGVAVFTGFKRNHIDLMRYKGLGFETFKAEFLKPKHPRSKLLITLPVLVAIGRFGAVWMWMAKISK